MLNELRTSLKSVRFWMLAAVAWGVSYYMLHQSVFSIVPSWLKYPEADTERMRLYLESSCSQVVCSMVTCGVVFGLIILLVDGFWTVRQELSYGVFQQRMLLEGTGRLCVLKCITVVVKASILFWGSLLIGIGCQLVVNHRWPDFRRSLRISVGAIKWYFGFFLSFVLISLVLYYFGMIIGVLFNNIIVGVFVLLCFWAYVYVQSYLARGLLAIYSQARGVFVELSQKPITGMPEWMLWLMSAVTGVCVIVATCVLASERKKGYEARG